MSIQKDAGELLLYSYKLYEKGEMTISEDVLNKNNWEMIRLRNAVQYLQDKGLIKVISLVGGHFIIEKLFPVAIDIIENQPSFKHQFGFTVNLALIQFSWEVTES